MKTLKFILAGCLVFIGIGVVGTGVTLGEMYKTNQMTFEIKDEKDLKATALEDIYINSDVPVRIMPTEGKPYVTFDASGNGVIFPEPKYELQVTSEGTTSHINLKQTQSSEIYLFSSDWNKELVVYLPEKDIETLQVKINENYYNGRDSLTLASKSNIKNLSLNANRIDLNLDGGYNKIDINTSGGSVNIQSNTPAQVQINGGAKTVLKGQLTTVDIVNGDNDIDINSDIEAKVNIQAGYGNINIDGKLSELTVKSYGNEINVNSSTPYNTTISTSETTDVKLKGMIENAMVEGYEGDVKLYPTNTPKRIEILGENIDVHAVLPENISGFEIKKRTQYEEVVYEQGYENDVYSNREQTVQENHIYVEHDPSDNNNMYIDFKVKSENLSNGLKRIYYGDEAMKMFIDAPYGSMYITK